jgi:hypothetical protein
MSCQPTMPISSCPNRSPQTLIALHVASGNCKGAPTCKRASIPGRSVQVGLVLAPAGARHQPQLIRPQSGDSITDGRMTAVTLARRRGNSLSRHGMNSARMNAICGCLLSAQRVIQSERCHTQPLAGCHAALRQSAAIIIAVLSAAPAPIAM